MRKLNENEHVLKTPELIGTDQEKVDGIKFWADVVAQIHAINTSFISYENKIAVIDAFKAELEIVRLEIDNSSSRVSQDEVGIPSVDQEPVDTAEVNVVDLTQNSEVTGAISAPTVVAQPFVPPVKKAPTFEDLDKLRRVAGSGKWDKNFDHTKGRK